MDWIFNVSVLAASSTTISFVPQAIRTIRTKNTAAISLQMYSLFAFGTLMWLLYGLATRNLPIIVANAVTFVLAAIILFYKVRYK